VVVVMVNGLCRASGSTVAGMVMKRVTSTVQVMGRQKSRFLSMKRCSWPASGGDKKQSSRSDAEIAILHVVNEWDSVMMID
jgi:hypothetical protein